MNKRAKQINERLNFCIFSPEFIELSVKRIYSKSQDIRKIINYLIDSYQPPEYKG